MAKEKELVEVEKQVVPLQEAVIGMTIKSPEDFTIAVELGGQIKKAQKFVTEKKELLTKPLNEALKNARGMFKPFEDNLENLEKTLKGKMIDFKDEEEKKRLAIEARVDKGTMKQETAVTKVQDMTQKTERSETGAKATETFRLEYVVTDKSQIPLQFLVPDMVAIKQSFKEGQPVAGVEVRKIKSMSF